MNSGPVNAAYDILLTAIDLTRASCANDNYLAWLSRYSDALSGSGGIANYFANAALAFEEQAHPQICTDFDAFDARDNLADILMASAPLSSDELRGAVTAAIHEAAADSFPLPVLSPRDGGPNSFVAAAHLEWNGNGHHRSQVTRWLRSAASSFVKRGALFVATSS